MRERERERDISAAEFTGFSNGVGGGQKCFHNIKTDDWGDTGSFREVSRRN